MPLWRERNTQQLIDEELRRKKELEDRRRAQIAQQMQLDPPSPPAREFTPTGRQDFSTPPAQQATISPPQTTQPAPVDSGLMAEMRRMGGLDTAYDRPFQQVHREPSGPDRAIETDPITVDPEEVKSQLRGFVGGMGKGFDWMGRGIVRGLAAYQPDVDPNSTAGRFYNWAFEEREPETAAEKANLFAGELVGNLPYFYATGGVLSNLLGRIAPVAGAGAQQLSTLATRFGITPTPQTGQFMRNATGVAKRYLESMGRSAADLGAKTTITTALKEAAKDDPNALERISDSAIYGMLGGAVLGAVKQTPREYRAWRDNPLRGWNEIRIDPNTGKVVKRGGTSTGMWRGPDKVETRQLYPDPTARVQAQAAGAPLTERVTVPQFKIAPATPEYTYGRLAYMTSYGKPTQAFQKAHPKLAEQTRKISNIMARTIELPVSSKKPVYRPQTPDQTRALELQDVLRRVGPKAFEQRTGVAAREVPNMVKRAFPEQAPHTGQFRGPLFGEQHVYQAPQAQQATGHVRHGVDTVENVIRRGVEQGWSAEQIAPALYAQLPGMGLEVSYDKFYDAVRDLEEEVTTAPMLQEEPVPREAMEVIEGVFDKGLPAEQIDSHVVRELNQRNIEVPLNMMRQEWIGKVKTNRYFRDAHSMLLDEAGFVGVPPWGLTLQKFQEEYQSALEVTARSEGLREVTGQLTDPDTGEIISDVTPALHNSLREVWLSQVSDALKKKREVPTEVKEDYYRETNDLMKEASKPDVRRNLYDLSDHYVHGGPVKGLSEVLKDGISFRETEEGRAIFVGRLDHPLGYQASMTAVGGFGPRTDTTVGLEKQVGIGKERQYEPIAYILTPQLPAYTRDQLIDLDDRLEHMPEHQEFWKGRARASREELQQLYSKLRPELLKMMGPAKADQSHRKDPELILREELAGEKIEPKDIVGLVYDGALEPVMEAMKESGKALPIYGSDGMLRLDPKATTTPKIEGVRNQRQEAMESLVEEGYTNGHKIKEWGQDRPEKSKRLLENALKERVPAVPAGFDAHDAIWLKGTQTEDARLSVGGEIAETFNLGYNYVDVDPVLDIFNAVIVNSQRFAFFNTKYDGIPVQTAMHEVEHNLGEVAPLLHEMLEGTLVMNVHEDYEIDTRDQEFVHEVVAEYMGELATHPHFWEEMADVFPAETVQKIKDTGQLQELNRLRSYFVNHDAIDKAFMKIIRRYKPIAHEMNQHEGSPKERFKAHLGQLSPNSLNKLREDLKMQRKKTQDYYLKSQKAINNMGKRATTQEMRGLFKREGVKNTELEMLGVNAYLDYVDSRGETNFLRSDALQKARELGIEITDPKLNMKVPEGMVTKDEMQRVIEYGSPVIIDHHLWDKDRGRVQDVDARDVRQLVNDSQDLQEKRLGLKSVFKNLFEIFMVNDVMPDHTVEKFTPRYEAIEAAVGSTGVDDAMSILDVNYMDWSATPPAPSSWVDELKKDAISWAENTKHANKDLAQKTYEYLKIMHEEHYLEQLSRDTKRYESKGVDKSLAMERARDTDYLRFEGNFNLVFNIKYFDVNTAVPSATVPARSSWVDEIVDEILAVDRNFPLSKIQERMAADHYHSNDLRSRSDWGGVTGYAWAYCLHKSPPVEGDVAKEHLMPDKKQAKIDFYHLLFDRLPNMSDSPASYTEGHGFDPALSFRDNLQLLLERMDVYVEEYARIETEAEIMGSDYVRYDAINEFYDYAEDYTGDSADIPHRSQIEPRGIIDTYGFYQAVYRPPDVGNYEVYDPPDGHQLQQNTIWHIRHQDLEIEGTIDPESGNVREESRRSFHLEEAQSDAFASLRDALELERLKELLKSGVQLTAKDEIKYDELKHSVSDPPPKNWEDLLEVWLEHSLKQAVQIAARNNYEVFTFSTAQVQKDRWKVSNVVDRVVYVENKEDAGPYGWMYLYSNQHLNHVEYVKDRKHLSNLLGGQRVKRLYDGKLESKTVPKSMSQADVDKLDKETLDSVMELFRADGNITDRYFTPDKNMHIEVPDEYLDKAKGVYLLEGADLDLSGKMFDIVYGQKMKKFFKKYANLFGSELTEYELKSSVMPKSYNPLTATLSTLEAPYLTLGQVENIYDVVEAEINNNLIILSADDHSIFDKAELRKLSEDASNRLRHRNSELKIAMDMLHRIGEYMSVDKYIYADALREVLLSHGENTARTSLDYSGSEHHAEEEVRKAYKAYFNVVYPSNPDIYKAVVEDVKVRRQGITRPGFEIKPGMEGPYSLFRPKGEGPTPRRKKEDPYQQLTAQQKANAQRIEQSIKSKLGDPDNKAVIQPFIDTTNKMDVLMDHYREEGTLGVQAMDALKKKKTTPFSEMNYDEVVHVMNATRNYINHLLLEDMKVQRQQSKQVRTKEQDDYLKNYKFTSNPNIENRWRGARTMQKTGFFEKMSEAVKDIKDGFDRSHKHLPNVGYYMPLRSELINLSKYSSIAGETTVLEMQTMLQDISQDAGLYNLFERYVVMADLAEDYKRYHEYLREQGATEDEQPWDWRFDFTKESFAQEWKKINETLQNYPEIKRALSEREIWWESFIEKYVEAQRKIGHEVEQKFTRANYYHRQVLDYADAKTSAIATRKMKTPRGRDWLRKRRVEGSELDFNTNYLESEFEVISQMHADMRKAEALALIEDKYSIYDDLVREADEYNQNRPVKDHKQWHEFLEDKVSKEGIPYTIYEPTEGNIFYMADTIPSNIAAQLYNNQLESYGVGKKDLRRVLAVGGRHKPFVVDENIAATLDDLIKNDKVGNAVGEVARELLTFWKKYQLVSPPRWLKYNLRNLSSDIEFPISLNLGTFNHLPRAGTDLYNHMIGGKTTIEDTKIDYHGENYLWAWVVRGGLQSNLQAQEMGEINKLNEFAKIARQYKSWKDVPGDVWDKYWKNARLTTDLRESMLRYASFIDYVKQMKANVDPSNVDSSGVILSDHMNQGLPDNYGGSIKEEIQELDNIYDRAYWLSNELLGAYDRVSQYGMVLRKYASPFWSWKEVNFRRFTRVLRNTENDPQILENIGRYAINKLQRAAGGGAITPNTPVPKNNMSGFAKSPLIAMRVAMWLLRAGSVWGSAQLWNNLAFPGHQDSLPERDRMGFYLVVGKTDDGYLYYNRLGFMTDLFEWMGDTPWGYVDDYVKGRKTAMDIAGEIASSPHKVLVSSLGPHFTTVFELTTGMSLFPDPSKPAPISDWRHHIAQNFGLSNTYSRLSGRPSRSYGDELQRIFAYKQLHNQGAYYDTRNEVRDYLKSQGVATGRFYADYNARREALFNLRQSIVYEDKEALERFALDYVAQGGDRDGLMTSLRNMHPLYGLSDERKIDFVRNWLDDDGRRRAVKSIDYYDNVILGGDTFDIKVD